MFQSTRPRGARPVNAEISSVVGTVSIHAPARGATYRIHFGSVAPLVSIHAPARGATNIEDYSVIGSGFNPRARAGRDAVFAADQLAGYDVSIHAPARGATTASSIT